MNGECLEPTTSSIVLSDRAGHFADFHAIAAESYLDVEAAKVGHEVLQRFHHRDALMANHPMEYHLDAHAEEGDKRG